MKYITRMGAGVLGLLPFVASAQAIDGQGAMAEFLMSIIDFINTVAIPFLLGLGFLFFVWGMFRFFIAGGANEDAREQGKNVIIYSVLGFVLIFIFWGVVQLFVSTTGLWQPGLPEYLLPTVPGA